MVIVGKRLRVVTGSPDDEALYGDTDQPTGNSQALQSDRVYGGLGHDSLFGDALELFSHAVGRSDRLYGDDGINLRGFSANAGEGDDTIYGDAVTMSDSAIGGADFIYGEGGDDTIYGDAGKMDGNVRGGADQLFGGAGVDSIYGDADELFGNAVGGHDTIKGGAGGDLLVGDGALNDQTVGGNDRILGEDGDDSIYGDNTESIDDSQGIGGHDILLGGQGNDWLFGDGLGLAEGGNDTLDGGIGNDHLNGNGGADRFVFTPGTGNDAIWDYHASEGDRVDVSAYEFREAPTEFALSLSGVLVTLAPGDTVEFIGMGADDFSTIDWLI